MNAELQPINERVARWLKLWEPGQWICPACGPVPGPHEGSTEIPCPDLTEAVWFVRLLKEHKPWIFFNANGYWRAEVGRVGRRFSKEADTPEEALLRAVDALREREAHTT